MESLFFCCSLLFCNTLRCARLDKQVFVSRKGRLLSIMLLEEWFDYVAERRRFAYHRCLWAKVYTIVVCHFEDNRLNLSIEICVRAFPLSQKRAKSMTVYVLLLTSRTHNATYTPYCVREYEYAYLYAYIVPFACGISGCDEYVNCYTKWR